MLVGDTRQESKLILVKHLLTVVRSLHRIVSSTVVCLNAEQQNHFSYM